MVNAMHWTPWPRTRLPVPALCLMVTATLAMACSPQEDSEATASMEDAAEPAPQTTPDAGAEVPGDKLSGVEVPEGEAATAGRLVDTAGAPIEGLRVLCCSSETCLIDTTDADGVYLHIGIVPTHRYKMQVTDAGGTYSDLIYYQPYVVDQLSVMEVLGAALCCFESALGYAQERVQFGRPIAGFQLTQKKFVDMGARIVGGHLLAMHLAGLKARGQLSHIQVSLGKRENVALALDIARESRNILGGSGIMDEYPMMRHAANLESVYTYEGTHEVHTLTIGRALTGLNAFT
jgi:hypothetical protein